jgi:hypothetical protein
MKREKKFTKGPRDSRDLIRERNVLRKRHCESLNPIVKGIPTERLETTTSCSLNLTVKVIPTEKA